MAQNYCSLALTMSLSVVIVPLKVGAQTFPTDNAFGAFNLKAADSSVRYSDAIIWHSESTVSANASITTGIFAGDDVDMSLFSGFGDNILHIFTGENLYYHLTAIAVTPILVNQDIDYHVEHFFNQHPSYGMLARPAPFTGDFLPIIAGGSLLAYAEFKNDDETLGASFAVIQASLIELMDNTVLKAVTGRPGPNWRQNSNMEDLSETFRFGLLRGGVFNGWPSGHTGATMAVVSALTNYYPDETWLKIVGYGFVAYTMYGVTSVNKGGMHWFSDAVAGALMSYTIGSTVGKYYRDLYSSLTGEQIETQHNGLSFGVTLTGIGVSYSF